MLLALLVLVAGTGAVACSGAGDGNGNGREIEPGGTAAGSAGAISTPDAARGRVLFLGTSLTAGLGLDADSAYPQRIQRKIDSASLRFEVVNAGVSGETSAGLLQRLDWVLRQPAQVIVIETGANDGLRGQSVPATRATIARILDRVHGDRPGARVALVQMEAPTNLGAQYTGAFHAMFPSLAKEKGVTLLPFLLDGVAGRTELNQADGVHPNDAGERIVAENVWGGLRPLLASQP